MNIEISKQINKIDLEEFAQKTINNVVEGYESAMETIAKCEAVLKIVETIKKTIMQNAVDEFQARKEGNKKTLIIGNFELEHLETGIRYDYSEDVIWRNITQQIKEANELFIEPLEKEKKSREEVLKATARNYVNATKTFDVDTNTGETFERIPPTRTHSEIVKVKIK
jgi:hypothetical protein